jgi:SAM-dependent methyltransferase
MIALALPKWNSPEVKEAADQFLSLSIANNRLNIFFREYFVGSLTRIAMNLVFLRRLIKTGDCYLDVGSLGIEPAIIKGEFPSCTVRALTYEGNRIGVGPEGFFETDDPHEANCVHIEQVDVERQKFPYPENSFDVVTCFEVLEHLKYSPIPMMKEIKRVLKPEGRLILTTPNINSARSLIKMLCGRSPQQCPYFHSSLDYGVIHPKEYTLEEVHDLFTSLGFKVELLDTADMRPTKLPERALVLLLSAAIPILRLFLNQVAYRSALHEKIIVVAKKGSSIISETPRSLFESGANDKDRGANTIENRKKVARRPSWLRDWFSGNRKIRPSNMAAEIDYKGKLQKEVEFFKSYENVHDLPGIFHYWSNKYLVPKYRQFSFGNPKEFFSSYMQRACKDFHNETCCFVSVGSGNCDVEVELVEGLLQSGMNNFVLECLDVNQPMLNRGRALAQKKKVDLNMVFSNSDINSWRPKEKYHIVMANQSLHHFVELEILFDKIQSSLLTQGYFLTDDMIGRNGHMRWPEALVILNDLWKELPNSYKYNHQLKRLEVQFDNWDCSKEAFEGIRSQDILPLLIQKFQFDLFLGFANVVDVFVDRSFGHNFDTEKEWDLKFIDKVHEIDESNIESGNIKPTHMTAAMTKHPCDRMKTYKHLTPKFCVRWP